MKCYQFVATETGNHSATWRLEATYEEQLIETLSGLVDHRLKPGVDDNARFLFCMHLKP